MKKETASDQTTTDEPLCSGTLIWKRQQAPALCERCGASKDELCGDFDAQETQWNESAESHE